MSPVVGAPNTQRLGHGLEGEGIPHIENRRRFRLGRSCVLQTYIYIYIIGLFIFFHCQLTCFNEMQKILLSRIFIMRSMMMTVSWRMIIIGKSSSKRWMQLDHTAWHVGSPKPYPKQMHQRKRICGRISRCLRKTSKFLSICVPLPSLTNCS